MQHQDAVNTIKGLIPEFAKGDPSSVIVKYATERELSPEQVRKLGQIYNTGVTIDTLEKSANRGAEATLIDPTQLVRDYIALPTTTVKEANIWSTTASTHRTSIDLHTVMAKAASTPEPMEKAAAVAFVEASPAEVSFTAADTDSLRAAFYDATAKSEVIAENILSGLEKMAGGYESEFSIDEMESDALLATNDACVALARGFLTKAASNQRITRTILPRKEGILYKRAFAGVQTHALSGLFRDLVASVALSAMAKEAMALGDIPGLQEQLNEAARKAEQDTPVPDKDLTPEPAAEKPKGKKHKGSKPKAPPSEPTKGFTPEQEKAWDAYKAKQQTKEEAEALSKREYIARYDREQGWKQHDTDTAAAEQKAEQKAEQDSVDARLAKHWDEHETALAATRKAEEAEQKRQDDMWRGSDRDARDKDKVEADAEAEARYELQRQSREPIPIPSEVDDAEATGKLGLSSAAAEFMRADGAPKPELQRRREEARSQSIMDGLKEFGSNARGVANSIVGAPENYVNSYIKEDRQNTDQKALDKDLSMIGQSTTLRRLMLTDPILREMDPATVASVYNSIAEANPEAAEDPNLIRLALREAVDMKGVTSDAYAQMLAARTAKIKGDEAADKRDDARYNIEGQDLSALLRRTVA